MKFNHGLKREKLVAVTLCFGVSLNMSFQVGRTEPFIATMLGIITVGVYLIVLSGQWRSKNT